MKLEFGGGETPHNKKFKQCDVRQLDGVSYVCNAWEIDKHVEHNTVEHIFSRHFFEHLTFRQGEAFIQAAYKILKSGGVYEMLIPNMQMHINQWKNNDNFEHAKAGFWGWQRGELDDVWDVHKSGYTQNSLKAILEKYNFKNIEFMSSDVVTDKHIHVRCLK